MRALPCALTALALAAGLAGCGDADETDLAGFVSQVQSQKMPPIEPMPEIAAYTPYTYQVDGRRSPFAAPEPARQTSISSVHPDLDRPIDPLEQFPLDSLSLVGTLTSSGVTYALIRAPDGVVHRAAPGTHLGRNYGEIDRVDKTGVSLTEIVPDGNGGYVKRSAMLALSNDRTS